MNNSPQNIRMMKAAMFHEEGLPSVAWLIELIEGERQEEIAADLRDFIDASGGFNRVSKSDPVSPKDRRLYRAEIKRRLQPSEQV